MPKWAKRTLTVVAIVLVVALVLGVGVLAICTGDENSTSSQKWVAETIQNYYYEDVGDIDYRNTSIEEMVGLLDQYSEYYTYDEYMSVYYSNAGIKSGIGIAVSDWPDGGALVNEVYGDSPAYKAGLRKGDIVEQITAYGNFGNWHEVGGASDLIETLAGYGTDTDVYIYTKDSGTLTMRKAAYTASYVFMYTNETGYSIEYDDDYEPSVVECASDAIEYLPDNSAYIQILEFYGNADAELGMMLEKFYELEYDTIYLDIRNNGGGYMSVLQGMASYFIGDDDPVTYAEYREGTSYTEDETVYLPVKPDDGPDVRVSDDTTIYVLANNSTASASEALLGMLISYGFVEYEDVFISSYPREYLEMFGKEDKNERTYGKGIMQKSVMNGRTGEVLKLTVATLVWPDGETCIHDRGLTEEDGCRIVKAGWSVTRGDEELRSVVELSLPGSS
ncbi:MAG: S41 family peptidase [Clostridia bacterium]|nr:S41 family peptidase [Clostridia bacterium]